MRHPIRFGLQTVPENAQWEEMVKLWQFADDLGYDSLWTSDHFIPSCFADQHRPVLEGWAALAGLAALTSRVSCGIMVSGVTYRNPAHLAKLAATVDHMSGGRLAVGIGSGYLEAEHDMYGYHFPDRAERVHRVGEAIQILQRLWTEDRASFKGKYYQVSDAICEPKPVQKPHPPIWVASGGVQLGMRYVARYADGWNVVGPPEVLKDKIELLERYCDEAGRDFDQIEKSVQFMKLFLTDDRKRADEFVQQEETWRGVKPGAYRMVHAAGTPDDLKALVRKHLDNGYTHFLAQVVQPYDYEGIERWYKEVALEFKGK